jgi:transcriptional regulator with XRE-family HTH domain
MSTSERSAGARLRDARQAAGMTQEELAARSGLSVRAIGDLERERTRRPYPRSIRLLVSTLGLPQSVSDELIAHARSAYYAQTASP